MCILHRFYALCAFLSLILTSHRRYEELCFKKHSPFASVWVQLLDERLVYNNTTMNYAHHDLYAVLAESPVFGKV